MEGEFTVDIKDKMINIFLSSKFRSLMNNPSLHYSPRICFDIDGIICKGPDDIYGEPIQDNIDTINFLYDHGVRIMLNTGRTEGMKDHTVNQLKEWGVKYHEIRFDKPRAHFYVDDRNLSMDTLRSLIYFKMI